MKIDDLTLTEKGIEAQGHGRVLMVACGALAREILVIKEVNGLDHLDITCLPAILHNTPKLITERVEATVAAHKDDYAEIFVVYADCGTGGLLQAACERMGVKMVAGPHCYSFFEGNETFADNDEITAFYLTDFLVRQFDAFVTKPLGLDRHPELRDIYFGNYEKLVYQAQTNDPALDRKAEACAVYLGLRYERRFTGYGDLETTLKSI